mgnify:CR=1 FL=1
MTEIINVLQNWTNLSIVGGSLIFGYILKNYIPLDNKHIPAVMAGLGIGLAFVLNGYVSFEVTVLGGALSGLASTGLHQVFHQYIKGDKKEVDADFFDVYKNIGGDK